MRIEFSESIETDLEAIAEYIARDNPRRAVTFLQDIRAELQRIGDGPLRYQLRPELGDDARLGVVGRYVILFRVAQDVVYVERIVQGNRQLTNLFL